MLVDANLNSHIAKKFGAKKLEHILKYLNTGITDNNLKTKVITDINSLYNSETFEDLNKNIELFKK